jgi:hypothetical protein
VDIRYGSQFLAERYRPGARDQRLAEFAQGRWGDGGRSSGWLTSGWLALQASDVSRPEVLAEATGDELLGIGRAWKSLETWSFCGKLAVVRELIRRFPLNEDDEPGPVAGGLPDEWDPRLHHEVAAALGISVAAAGKLVNLAWTLDARLPGISQALLADRLDPGRAKMIVDETSILETEGLFARAEAIILAGLPGCKTWSDLQRLVQRAVITVDPEGARRRRERAEREGARVRFWRESTGTCALRGTGLPTDQALAATANIEARALEYKAVAIRRPMDILRVMAYVDLINGVPVAQRAAWAQAEDDARQAQAAPGEADRQAGRDARLREAAAQARDKFRERARARAGRHPGSPGSPGSPGRPGRDDGSGDGRPCGSDDGQGGRPLRDGDPGGGPGDDHDDGSDGSPRPEGGWPDDWPGDDWPAAAHPGGAGFNDDGFDGDSLNGASPDAAGLDGAGQDDGPPPEDPGTGDNDGGPCPQCAGPGGVTGLAIRANLTLPAGAIPWLADLAGGWGGSDSGGGDGGGGGGGPGGGGDRAGPGGGRNAGSGRCPVCEDRGSGRMLGGSFPPVREHLTFPLLTLLDLAERPGEAHGLGALDPALARHLAAAGARHPASEFCVTIISEQGYAIGHGCAKSPRGKAPRGRAGRAIPVSPDRATFTPAAGAGPRGGFGSWILTLPGPGRHSRWTSGSFRSMTVITGSPRPATSRAAGCVT